MDDVEIRDNEQQTRYEVRERGELAGFAEYRIDGSRMTLFHTEVDEAHAGHGLGGRLARGALDDAIARGLQVVPVCPFIAHIVRDEPDRYLQAIVPSLRERVMEG